MSRLSHDLPLSSSAGVTFFPLKTSLRDNAFPKWMLLHEVDSQSNVYIVYICSLAIHL